MPTDIEVLHKIIVDDAKLKLQEKYGKLNVILNEPQCSGSLVTICNLPENIIVINLDSYWSIDKMFTHDKGQCKRADFVIIANDNQGVIIHIEIKKKKSLEKIIIQQLTGSKCFILFCQNIGQAQAFWNRTSFLNDYVHRYVSIRNISISKKTTRIPPRCGINDCPERMLKISSPHHLMFQHLIG